MAAENTPSRNSLAETARVTEGLLQSGQISKSAAAKIYSALGVNPQTKGDAEPANAHSDALTWLAGGFAQGFTALGAALAGIFVTRRSLTPQPPLLQERGRSEAEAVRPVVGGIDALLSFETLAATLKPLFNEYVWWFVAMILVLSGSVMGIREAWLRFEGILRPLTILFAFFTYHTLFLGLGIFLTRRNAATGRMLLILASTLIPVMFWVAASVTRQAAEAGAIATGVALALSLVTLYPIAQRIGIPYFSAIFYLPVPFALSALSALGATVPALTSVVIVALAASILTATGMQTGARAAQKFIFAIAGILILLFILISLPLGPDEDLAQTLRLLGIMAVLAQFTFLLHTRDFTHSNLFTAIEVAMYACLALMPVIAARSFAGGSATLLPLSYRVFTYFFAIAIFMRAARIHNAAVHPQIFLTMLLGYHISRLITTEIAWHIFAFTIFPLALVWFSRAFDERKQKLYLYWAAITGLLGSLTAWAFAEPHAAAAVIGLLTAMTIHRGAGKRRSAFHYLSIVGLIVFIGRMPLFAGMQLMTYEIFAVLAVIYAIGGWLFEKKADPQGPDSAYPIDDLSLICAVIALFALNTFSQWGDATLIIETSGRVLPLRPLFWFAGIFLFLTLRTLRDRSALISLTANLGALFFLANWLRLRDHAEGAAFLFVAAVFFYGVTFFCRNGNAKNAEKFGRIFLMQLRLPFNMGSINNIANAAGATTLLTLVLLFFTGFIWIGNPDYDRRPLILGSEIGLMALIVCIFHFKTFAFLRLRGNLIALFALLFTIALTAIINRLGRPLPMDAVGIRLLLLFPVVALITAAIKIYGPRYGQYLGEEKQGHWYFLAPVTGVIGLTFLLGYDALAVSTFDFDRTFYFVPPTLYLALALYPLILAHTVSSHLRHVFYFFIPIFLGAVFAERSFLGPALANQNSFSLWVPEYLVGQPFEVLTNFSIALTEGYSYLAFRQNIVLGLAAGLLFLGTIAMISRHTISGQRIAQSILSKNITHVAAESGIWSIIFTIAIALLSFQVAAIPPGLILIGVAAFYLIAGVIRTAAGVLFIAGLLIVHGGAHLTQVYGVWPGPTLVLAAILMILPAKKIAAKLDMAERFVSETTFLAGILYIAAAFFYTATEGRPVNAMQAGYSVLNANFHYLVTGGFFRAYALPLSFLMTALFFTLALRRLEGHTRIALALFAHLAFVSALTTALWLLLSLLGNTVQFMAAAPFMIVAILFFEMIITSRLNSLKDKDPEVYAGLFSARDAMLVFCGLLFIPISQNLNSPIPYAGIALLAGLLLYLIVNIQAAFTSKKTRYVYIAQMTIAGIYYSARPILGINSAQTDAFFVFAYAFALLGISIAAERFGATVVSESTRRFAALLPFCAGLLVDNFRSLQVAFYSVISSGLYFALSRLGERNLFAALAAIMLNAALFFIALSQGFDSSEFYAFPLGLTIIFFATIFKDSLSVVNQARVRMIGGLVAYVPAAIQVTFRSGLADNPLYSLVFGAVCLVGILMGTVFRVRSYLFLGALFFTLNLIANLVQEGLQNQFIGFVLLTVTGLGLILVLITYNLKKESIHALLLRLREKFSAWR